MRLVAFLIAVTQPSSEQFMIFAVHRPTKKRPSKHAAVCKKKKNNSKAQAATTTTHCCAKLPKVKSRHKTLPPSPKKKLPWATM